MSRDALMAVFISTTPIMSSAYHKDQSVSQVPREKDQRCDFQELQSQIFHTRPLTQGLKTHKRTQGSCQLRTRSAKLAANLCLFFGTRDELIKLLALCDGNNYASL